MCRRCGKRTVTRFYQTVWSTQPSGIFIFKTNPDGAVYEVIDIVKVNVCRIRARSDIHCGFLRMIGKVQ